MNWRKIFIGVSSGLILPILAGLLVWFLTREAPVKEGLTYRISNYGSVLTSEGRLSFLVVDLENKGLLRASNVRFQLSDDNSNRITERNFSPASDLAEPARFENIDSGFRAFIPNMLPQDSVRFSVVYRGNRAVRGVIDVRSDNGIGTVANIGENQSILERFGSNGLFASFVVFGLVLLYIQYGLRSFSRRTGITLRLKDRNNTGFVLIHADMIDEADTVLSAALLNGDASPFALSNMAAVKSLKGDKIAGDNLILAAMNWSYSNHAVACSLLNRAIIAMVDKDWSAVNDNLKQSIEKSSDIREYIDRSVLFLRLSNEHNELKEILERL